MYRLKQRQTKTDVLEALWVGSNSLLVKFGDQKGFVECLVGLTRNHLLWTSLPRQVDCLKTGWKLCSSGLLQITRIASDWPEAPKSWLRSSYASTLWSDVYDIWIGRYKIDPKRSLSKSIASFLLPLSTLPSKWQKVT